MRYGCPVLCDKVKENCKNKHVYNQTFFFFNVTKLCSIIIEFFFKSKIITTKPTGA